MNIVNAMKMLFGFLEAKESDGRPGWAGKRYRMKHSRTPFSSNRKRTIGKQRMTVEEFEDKDARNARFQELRAAGVRHVNKFSTARPVDPENPAGHYRSIWCVVRP